MSAQTVARTTARTTERGAVLRRPALELVPAARTRAGRTPFAVVVVGLLVAGLLGLLVLNTVLAQDAFRLHTLKAESRALEDREQALQREVEALRAPQALAARAGALGMVQAGPPAFLRLPDGAVLGAETAAEVPETPEAAAARAGTEAPADVADEADAEATAEATEEAAAEATGETADEAGTTSETESTDATDAAEDDE